MKKAILEKAPESQSLYEQASASVYQTLNTGNEANELKVGHQSQDGHERKAQGKQTLSEYKARHPWKLARMQCETAKASILVLWISPSMLQNYLYYRALRLEFQDKDSETPSRSYKTTKIKTQCYVKITQHHCLVAHNQEPEALDEQAWIGYVMPTQVSWFPATQMPHSFKGQHPSLSLNLP